jgi:hypothetical protein
VNIYWPAVIDGGIPVLVGMYATAVAYGMAVGPKRTSGPVAALIPHFKWMGPVLIVFGFFLGWQGHARAAHPSAEELARQISAKLSLPVQVDEVTRLDAVQGQAEVISFHYTLLATPESPDWVANIRSKLQEQGHATACTNADFTKFLNNGYSIELRYSFLESAENISVLLAPELCGH